MNNQSSYANNTRDKRYIKWESKYNVLKQMVHDNNGESLELDKHNPITPKLKKWVTAQRKSFKDKANDYNLERKDKL